MEIVIGRTYVMMAPGVDCRHIILGVVFCGVEHAMITKAFGWLFLILALIAISVEGVLALGTEAETGLVTGEVLTLIIGGSPEMTERPFFNSILEHALGLPIWVVGGGVGFLFLLLSRKRDPGLHEGRRLMRRR